MPAKLIWHAHPSKLFHERHAYAAHTHAVVEAVKALGTHQALVGSKVRHRVRGNYARRVREPQLPRSAWEFGVVAVLAQVALKIANASLVFLVKR